MALKSGHMGYLEVPRNTIAGSMKFLDSVQSDGGAKYGYVDQDGKIRSSLDALFLLDILFYPSIFVDLASGAMWKARGPTDGAASCSPTTIATWTSSPAPWA